jgi:hypothetical protein
MRLQLLAQPLEEFVNKHDRTFGGMYYTQDSGRLLAIVNQTAATTAEDVDTALALVPDGLELNFAHVRHTLAELVEARDKIDQAGDGIGVTFVGVDTALNGVEVHLAARSDSTAPARLIDVPVTVKVGDIALTACWQYCKPWRGGMQILNFDPTYFNHGNCTWGFYGTKGTSARYAFTAGHCGEVGDALSVRDQVPPPDHWLTYTDGAVSNTYDQGVSSSVADAMVAHVKGNANFAFAPFNTIVGSSSDLSHQITTVKNNTQTKGSTVCFFGWKTHSASPCGTISITGVIVDAVRDDGKHLHLTDLVEMTKTTDQGDSGGPVYSGLAAYGLVTAADNANGGRMIYSKALNVETDLSTNICTSSAC